jgi:hypothetical protein
MSSKKYNGAELFLVAKASLDLAEAKSNSAELVKIAKEKEKRETAESEKLARERESDRQERESDKRKRDKIENQRLLYEHAERYSNERKVKAVAAQQRLDVVEKVGLSKVGGLALDMVMTKYGLGEVQGAAEIKLVAKREGLSFVEYKPGSVVAFNRFVIDSGLELPTLRAELLCATILAAMVGGLPGPYQLVVSECVATIKQRENLTKGMQQDHLEDRKIQRTERLLKDNNKLIEQFTNGQTGIFKKFQEELAVHTDNMENWEAVNRQRVKTIFSGLVMVAFTMFMSPSWWKMSLLIGAGSVLILIGAVSSFLVSEIKKDIDGVLSKISLEHTKLAEHKAKLPTAVEVDNEVSNSLKIKFYWSALTGNIRWDASSSDELKSIADRQSLNSMSEVATASAVYWLCAEFFEKRV